MFSTTAGCKNSSEMRTGTRRSLLSPLSQQQSPFRRLQGSRRLSASHQHGESFQNGENTIGETLESSFMEEEEEGMDDEDEGDDNEDQDDDQSLTPLLPIFEAAQLDALPVYNLTHVLRMLVASRCETTLSWDQLRSPQVSQFLVKPIQQQILTSQFSKATLYALMANCLQFNKEAYQTPGNSGTSKTRAMVCELLSIKLLKEFSTRELIDALSYDFFPLQGLAPEGPSNLSPVPNWSLTQRPKQQARATRISTLEIAIRAQAKRFLAHPLVVQQLEAIWAGNIVFHSAADHMHRAPTKFRPSQAGGYGAIDTRRPVQIEPSRKQEEDVELRTYTIRRTVSLYNPKEASLLKLSRLRVPRYRHFLSTCSLAVLLGLFIAVLSQRSLLITPLEVIFWFWSAGFMLDEVVGFNEQGFSLYIMSFWNTFDLGILLIFVCYYFLRLYGILLIDAGKRSVADLAYDVLAVNAVLLFPRLFSVLDHYRYFSQLLIAFRMMASDLIAVFILIIISCSGFFIAFTLSFSNDDFGGGKVIYALFQILMGFTPAAWEQWDHYNALGKGTMAVFLVLCHFLIVTILITVLTNTFMAIAQNANDEHQFLFAVNTISMVKSDALFSYIAPTNVIAWILTPLRYVMSFRSFVHMNRTAIKATHWPVLFIICFYERLMLAGSLIDIADRIERRGRKSLQTQMLEPDGPRLNLFSPKLTGLREPSIATYQKDRALDEVFRTPYRGNTARTLNKYMRKTTSRNVSNWMQDMGPDGTAAPPSEQDHSIIDMLDRPGQRNASSFRRFPQRRRELSLNTRSAMSDPEDFGDRSRGPSKRSTQRRRPLADFAELDDEDGDDEMATNDNMTIDKDTPEGNLDGSDKENEESYFPRRDAPRPPQTSSSSRTPRAPLPRRQRTLSFQDEEPDCSSPPPPLPIPTRQQDSRHGHQRNLSTNTVLYNPQEEQALSSSQPTTAKQPSQPVTALNSGTNSPRKLRRPPNTPLYGQSTIPPRYANQSLADISQLIDLNRHRGDHHHPSAMIDIASDLGDNKPSYLTPNLPASLATQMAYATRGMERLERERRAAEAVDEVEREDQGRMGRLMLARMNTLEEGFREVLREVRDWRREGMGESRVGSLEGSVDGVSEGAMREGRGKDKDRGKGRSKVKEKGKGKEKRSGERIKEVEMGNEVEGGGEG